MKARLFIFFALFYAGFIQAQNITGPTTVNVGDTIQYTFTNGTLYMSVTWATSTYGTTLTKWNVGTTYYAKIIWTAPGTSSLTVLDQTYVGRGNLSVNINIGTPTTAFTLSPGCASTTITRTKNPPSGVNWYWQTSSTGTSTVSSAPTYAVPSTNTYYLRARWGSTGAWSTSSKSTGSVTVYATPTAPTTATNGDVISNVAASVSVSVNAASNASGYQWFIVPTGGTALSGITTNTYTASLVPGVNQTFYVLSVNGPCVNPTRKSVTASIHPEPILSATNNGEVVFGNSVSISTSNYTYGTYQWLDENGANIAGATSSSYSTNVVGTYKVKVTKGNSLPFTSLGQNVFTQNYIISTDVLVDNITNEATANTFAVGLRNRTIQFFDGLGRTIQTVTTQSSPASVPKDIVQIVDYDLYGRESKKYLPYTSGTNGWLKPNPISDQLAFYQTGGLLASDPSPLAETRYEPSPLNRILEQGSTGLTWQPDASNSYTSTDRTIKFTYQTNDANEVILWGYTPATTTSAINVVNTGYYPVNTLFRNRTKDEQYNEVIEYKDKEGRVILKKVQAPLGLWAQTYYVYDDTGKLVVVLPPEAVVALTN